MNHLKSLVMMPIMKYSLFPSLCFTSQQQLFLPFTLFYSSWLTWLLLRCFYYEKKVTTKFRITVIKNTIHNFIWKLSNLYFWMIISHLIRIFVAVILVLVFVTLVSGGNSNAESSYFKCWTTQCDSKLD